MARTGSHLFSHAYPTRCAYKHKYRDPTATLKSVAFFSGGRGWGCTLWDHTLNEGFSTFLVGSTKNFLSKLQKQLYN